MTWKTILLPLLLVAGIHLLTRSLGLTAHPYTLLLLSVALCSWRLGLWSGLLALALSCLVQPSYLLLSADSSGRFIFDRDSGEFILSAVFIVYLTHKLTVTQAALVAEREAFQRQKAEAFTDAIDLMSIQLADLLTVIIAHSEMALPEGEALDEIRAAGVRGGKLVAELQLMARSKKNEL